MAGKYKKLLTKSNYLLALQCTKLFHVQLYDKKRIPEPDDSALHRFKTGDEIEAIAKTLFENGIDLRLEDFEENLRASLEAIEKEPRVPLFEPAFLFDQLYSRADVLVPVDEDEWDIVEMKSATKVKEINIHDVSFQKHVYEKCGLKIRKCFLMHINRDYVKNGEIEPERLFTKTDITDEVTKAEKGIEERIEKFLKIANNETEPAYTIGNHCSSPYNCPLRKECWADLPGGNILEFYRKEEIQAFDIKNEGRIKIDKVPDFYSDNSSQLHKYTIALNKGNNFDEKILKEFMNKITYPIYFLDIQTINPAVPKYDGMRPYQRIPFQFSLHIKENKHANSKHFSFLADGKTDPRYILLKFLKDNIKNTGTILVYEKNKELSILKDLSWSQRYFSEWINNLTPRIKDLWEIFENFHFFDIEGKINSKIKYVIPRFSTLEHEDLTIKNGTSRGLEFERLIFNNNRDVVEKAGVREELRNKAREDTQSMIYIFEALERVYCG